MNIRLLFLIVLLSSSGCASRFFYYPDARVYGTPGNKGMAYEDVFFESRGGVRLHGWFIPAKENAKGTVIQFHGNAENMTSHFNAVAWLHQEGFNLFVFDYRGYGKSEGRPSREGLYQDGIAAIRYVLNRKDVDRHRVVVIGQSLGAATALAVMGRQRLDVRAVVSDSGFYSYRSMVREKTGDSWLSGLLSMIVIGNGRSAGPVVDDVAPIPLLIVHGTEDRVVSYGHGERLFDQAGEPKTFWRIENGHHTDFMARPEYRKKLLEFLEPVIR
ncbi:MAG: alpha/beta hydrolase [Verrucomicrobiota bacterium]